MEISGSEVLRSKENAEIIFLVLLTSASEGLCCFALPSVMYASLHYFQCLDKCQSDRQEISQCSFNLHFSYYG